MKVKDIWKWLLSKYDNAVLLEIYKNNNLICKGFRTNTIQDVKTNRKRLITNLLSNENYTKLLAWSRNNSLIEGDEKQYKNKEINELVELSKEKGATTVLLKLISENEEQLAKQLFATLQDETSSLLEIPNQSIEISGNNVISNESYLKKQEQKTKEEVCANKTEGKKFQRLVQKVENLTNELKKRDALHKAKVEELEKSQSNSLRKLHEKNHLYGKLLKEREAISNEYEQEKEQWKEERDNFTREIELLEIEVKKLKEDIELKSYLMDESEEVKIQILVIGRPASLIQFKSEKVKFEFVDANEVHDYEFSNEYNAYWVLLYELSQKDQLLLKVNESYANLDENIIKICKDFIEVKREINKYNKLEARAN
ncbi:hypothetical protein [Rossellomorea vietnamensis]|uniref:hypothetical protein n=1 Tax=Rossellomorea vietnamensis TaxID=218284 RepID=UPI00077C81FE|nr:hypothetical protein [Rossellomorea vietnamensis]